MYQIKRIVADGTAEPLLLAEVKSYLRVDYDAENDLITELITLTRRLAEDLLNRALVVQTITYYTDDQDTEYLLPFPSHDKINSVTVNGTLTADYVKKGLTQFKVVFDYLESIEFVDYSLQVEYVTLADIPDGLKAILLQAVAEFWVNRGARKFSPVILSQLLQYRIYQ